MHNTIYAKAITHYNLILYGRYLTKGNVKFLYKIVKKLYTGVTLCRCPGGTYRGTIFIKHMQAGSISFVAPKVKNKETVHIICESTDMHTPPLTGFDRVVVNILP